MNRYVLTLLFVLVFASSAAGAIKVNDTAPAISLHEVDGREFNLSDHAGASSKEKGNGVILSFFASWCMGCRSELPLINSAVDELRSKGITVVIVDVKEDADAIKTFLAEINVDKPVVLSDRDGKAADAYQVRFFPTTFFIGADGRVKDIIFGEVQDKRELMAGAGQLLK
jgi:peroxiredoxin